MDEALPTTSSSGTANVPSGNRAIDFLPPYRVPDDDCLTCRTTLHNCAVDGGNIAQRWHQSAVGPSVAIAL